MALRFGRRSVPLEEIGEDPDPRVSFANERTMLAWIRTALAMVVSGVGVIHLLPSFWVPGGRRMIGLPLIVLGALMALTSYRRWEQRERALRLGEGVPRSRAPAAVAYGVGIVAVVAAVLSALVEAR